MKQASQKSVSARVQMQKHSAGLWQMEQLWLDASIMTIATGLYFNTQSFSVVSAIRNNGS